jgi:hypothetical protein
MPSPFRQRLLQCMCIIYGVMLLAYPRRFRREYGHEMMLVFRNRARDVLQNGNIWTLLPFSLHILDDWLATTLRERGDMEIFRRALLGAVTVMCFISIAASCYLALSYTILKGLGDIRPLMPLALFVAQGAITLVALNTILPGLSIDLFALAGALGIAWLGYSMVERTLSGPHFEGYALVLGTVGVLQGVLTLALFFWRLTKVSARRLANRVSDGA